MAYVMDSPKKLLPPTPVKKRQDSPFQKGKGPTSVYERALRAVAKQVGFLLKGYLGKDPLDSDKTNSLSQALKQYSEILGPWALHIVNNIFPQVDEQDKFAWRRHSKEMGLSLRQELENAPTGDVVKQIMRQNIVLIKSIPTEAAERVHKLVQENMLQSKRPDVIAQQIMDTEGVTRSRATLIARTEISKAQTALVRSRAEYIGSTGYTWRTANDAIVRESHRKMNGVFVKWDEPPTLDKMTGHAGEFPNCFPGSTKVSLFNGCRKIWRYKYSGPLVSIRLSNGFIIEATPNHPILTVRGWIPINLLNQGDDVVQVILNKNTIVKNDIDDFIPSFDELYSSLEFASVGNRKTKSPTIFNFHGDIPNSDVDEISFDDFLPFDDVSSLFETFSNLSFSHPYRRVFEIIFGAYLHIFCSFLSGRLHHFDSSLSVGSRHSKKIGFSSISDFDFIFNKNCSDSLSCAIILLANCQSTHSSQIIGDNKSPFFSPIRRRLPFMRVGNLESPSAESLAHDVCTMSDNLRSGVESESFFYKSLSIVKKEIIDFSNHVYTLQSDSGWYNIGTTGIATKNCRCFPFPEIPEG